MKVHRRNLDTGEVDIVSIEEARAELTRFRNEPDMGSEPLTDEEFEAELEYAMNSLMNGTATEDAGGECSTDLYTFFN